jgi:DNA-binding CsgD family transcriptional regulator
MPSSPRLTSVELFKIAGLPLKLNITAEACKEHPENYNKEKNVGSFDFILNWTNMAYTYISRSVIQILGYEHKIFLNKGYNFSLSLIHPDDVVIVRKIHLSIFKYYYLTAENLRSMLIFSYDVRIRSQTGKYVRLLRQSKFFAFTEGGRPRLERVNCTDISDLLSNTMITLLIHRCEAEGNTRLLYKEVFPSSLGKLSLREEQVLVLASNGHTSKQIADIMFVSLETIKSHRKNIIAKTSSRNLMEAIGLLKLNGSD